MPLTRHVERHFTSGETVRDIVIGMSDGLTVPFALAAGLSAAVASIAITEHQSNALQIVSRRCGGPGSAGCQVLATATRASGARNSCSGCLTVSTGQGAVRTTLSATLPMSRCATALRP